MWTKTPPLASIVMKTLRLACKMLFVLTGLALLWWLRSAAEDPIGEMVVDQDAFDHDDPGVDVDES